MIDWIALVTIVTIITGGVVSLGTLFINSRIVMLEKEVKDLRAVLASTHSLIMGQHDPIAALESVLIQLQAQAIRNPALFGRPTAVDGETKFPKVDEVLGVVGD